MKKQMITLAFLTLGLSYVNNATAQSEKTDKDRTVPKKSRYYQNNVKENDEFNVQGFYREPDKNEVDQKPKEDEYDVSIRTNETEDRYKDEKRVTEEREQRRLRNATNRRMTENRRRGYYAYYEDGNVNTTPINRTYTPRVTKRVYVRELPDDREVKMTNNEVEYKTTFVKKRYTNLDVLCDDLDLAKIQRPVFKGICTECSRDVDLIIINKNLSSLEKNYQLKQSYMMRDKRLHETLDEDQYKKFLRIKDADEYLVITKDLEQKDGINK